MAQGFKIDLANLQPALKLIPDGKVGISSSVQINPDRARRDSHVEIERIERKGDSVMRESH